MTRRLAYIALWLALWPMAAIACLAGAVILAVWLLPALVGSIWAYDWERP